MSRSLRSGPRVATRTALAISALAVCLIVVSVSAEASPAPTVRVDPSYPVPSPGKADAGGGTPTIGGLAPTAPGAQVVNPGPGIPGQGWGEAAVTLTYWKGDVVHETVHPVPNNYWAGTGTGWRALWAPARVQAFFTTIDTEANYDYVWVGRVDESVRGGKVSGVRQNAWLTSNWGLMESPYTVIKTDYSVQSWGYRADQFVGIWTNSSPYSCVNYCGVPIKLSTIQGNLRYLNNDDIRWSISVRGAQQLRLHFTRIDVETNYDFITVTDEKGYSIRRTGTTNDYTTSWMEGGRLEVKLTSDGSVIWTGFDIDRVDVRWGWGGFFSGWGPRDSYGAQAFSFIGGDLRVDNDLKTFTEMDATLSAGKRIKHVAFAALPADSYSCGWWGCVYDWYDTVAFEFKIRINDGAGPILVNDIQMDETQPLPPGTGWTAKFGASIGVGFSFYGLNAGIGVEFSPDPGSSGPVKNFGSNSREAAVYIPVVDQGRSRDKAVGVVWKLGAVSGTEGYYPFKALTHVYWVHTQMYCFSSCGTTKDYVHQYASDVVEYSATPGETRGWVNGVLDYGQNANRFSNREHRIADLTMSGWRDNYDANNGWKEMDSRHSYFTTNEAGADAVSWMRLFGKLQNSHTVAFKYYSWTNSAWSLFRTDSSTTKANPPGGYYQPSGTWVWSNPTTGSYKVDVTIDGALVAQLTFYVAPS